LEEVLLRIAVYICIYMVFFTLYAPYPQAWHAPPSGPEKPASQRQLVRAELAAGEKAFAGQGMQGSEPLAAL